MDMLASRLSKIATGSFLISLTLTAGDKEMSYEMLYSLVALPIIFSGIFNWQPFELLMGLIARSLPGKASDITLTPTNA